MRSIVLLIISLICLKAVPGQSTVLRDRKIMLDGQFVLTFSSPPVIISEGINYIYLEVGAEMFYASCHHSGINKPIALIDSVDITSSATSEIVRYKKARKYSVVDVAVHPNNGGDGYGLVRIYFLTTITYAIGCVTREGVGGRKWNDDFFKSVRILNKETFYKGVSHPFLSNTNYDFIQGVLDP